MTLIPEEGDSQWNGMKPGTISLIITGKDGKSIITEMYDPEKAKAITEAGQKIIRETQQKLEDDGVFLYWR